MNRSGIFIVLSFLIFDVSLLKAQIQPGDSTRQISRRERHDFIRGGSHSQELKRGNYVVVATTLNETDAKKLVEEYKKLKAPAPHYGYVSRKALWYLCFSGEDDIDQARQKRDDLRKHKAYKDAWLLTIHN